MIAGTGGIEALAEAAGAGAALVAGGSRVGSTDAIGPVDAGAAEDTVDAGGSAAGFGVLPQALPAPRTTAARRIATTART